MSEGDRSGGRRRRRRRRGRRRDDGPRAPAGADADKQASSDEPSPGGRRQRRRRRKSAAPSAARSPSPSPSPSPADLDGAWDLPPASEPEAAEGEYGDDEAGLDSLSTRIPWGDDSDAPAPEIELASDLPANPPADDPDPSSAHLEADEEPGEPEALAGGPAIRNVAPVKFTSAGKIYLYDSGDAVYRRGEEVVVETDRGLRVGIVAADSTRRAQSRSTLKRILRRPSASDRRSVARNEERARETLQLAKSKARELELDVKVFRATHSLTGNKVQIHFSAEQKVDARPLARALSQELHCRVDLRQTGVRDEAKLVGGIGSCGQELCCTTWLPSFVPVSIKNAKDQGLVLNPAKVSGQCGRLKCCLVYEQATYSELRKGLPKLGKQVVTEAGEGRVVEVDVLRQRVRVRLNEGEFRVFSPDEVEPKFPSQRQPQDTKSR